MDGTKILTCKGCGIDKTIKNYYLDKYKPDGLRKGQYCKQCVKEYMAKKPLEKLNKTEINDEELKKMFSNTEYDNQKGKTTCHSAVFIGASKSGKSTLIKHLVKILEDRYDLIIIFSESLHDPMYDFINYGEKSKYLAFGAFNSNIILDIFEVNKCTKNALNILVLFDDLTNLKTRDNNEILQMFIRGRNSGISIFYSTQHYTLINKAMRSNANYIFLLRTNSSVKASLAEQFLVGVVKPPETIQGKQKRIDWLVDYITNGTMNYSSLIVDNLADPPRVIKYKPIL